MWVIKKAAAFSNSRFESAATPAEIVIGRPRFAKIRTRTGPAVHRLTQFRGHFLERFDRPHRSDLCKILNYR